jgi:SAM-dependent methyltransferase
VVRRKPSLGAQRTLAALLAALDRRVRTEGELSFPAAPALLEIYVRRLATLFANMGKRFSRAELAALRDLLEPRLKDGFEQSPNSRVHVKWAPEASPGTGIDYSIWLERGTLESGYDHWSTTEPFGAHADAKLMHLVRELEPPRRHRILDIGAGTGRNTLALARRGFAVDALETTPVFYRALRKTARSERLAIDVIQSNLFAPDLELGRQRYSLVVCSQVTSHFRSGDDLRALFQRAATCLRRGGSLLVNAFITKRGFEPAELDRQCAQTAWSTCFTPRDLSDGARDLPLSLVSDESVYEYEKAHQPAESWPPTSWFESWSRGFNCYRLKKGTPPMELRWLHYRKIGLKQRTNGARGRRAG